MSALRRAITVDSPSEEIQDLILAKFAQAISALNSRTNNGENTGNLVNRLQQSREDFQTWHSNQRHRPFSEQGATNGMNANLLTALRCLSRIASWTSSSQRLTLPDIRKQLSKFKGVLIGLEGFQEGSVQIPEEAEEDEPEPPPPSSIPNRPDRHRNQTSNRTMPTAYSYEPQPESIEDRDVFRNIRMRNSVGQVSNFNLPGSVAPRLATTWENIDTEDSNVHIGHVNYGPRPLDRLGRSQTIGVDPREPDAFYERVVRETRRTEGDDRARRGSSRRAG